MRPSGPPVIWRQGVHISGTVLWCDAPRARDLCFLSHASLPVRGRHRQVLTTARTLALLAARGQEHAWEPLPSPFGRRFTLGELRLELFPSGHLPGAASLLVAWGGRQVIYAGEANPLLDGKMALAEACEVRGAETLVVAAPLAALGGMLPARALIEAQLLGAVTRALDEKLLPVVLAPGLGAAQEAAWVLARAGLRPWAHARIAAYAECYRRLGLALPSLPTRKDLGAPLIWPLELRASPRLARLGRMHRIAASGLALDPNAAARLGVDQAVPLADHADLAALLEYVHASGARQVYFTAGYCEPVARALAARGVSAHPLGPPEQMKLF